ncbi:MAG TPA: flagellar basal body rod protein FlgC [Xanthomonadaceae bacterium]|jgi:flagellar basal-body rod protein FlgC|nr:flagellar basal body rod protein FlgC [Xanthomonadaceae bacterium]
MSSLPIFDVAGSALAAQSVRLNTIASNLANADSVGSSPETAYRPIEPVFESVRLRGQDGMTGVEVARVEPLDRPAIRRFEPGHPMADAQGYIYAPDVDPVAQMVNLISASRGYQANVEVINSARELALATLMIGR